MRQDVAMIDPGVVQEVYRYNRWEFGAQPTPSDFLLFHDDLEAAVA